MRPEDTQHPAPQPQPQPLGSTSSQSSSDQEAAANILRSKIDTIFDPNAPQRQTAAAEESTGPYNRSHSENPIIDEDKWRLYHNSWQDYYKTYYERYYVHHLQQAKQSMATPAVAPVAAEEISKKDQALLELRTQLVGNVQGAAKKAKKSRHFVPIISALCVMLLFLFMQYNRVLFANVEAYVSPGNIDPQNIIVDPGITNKVDPASTQLIIPKINVDVPVDYDATPDNDSQMAAMVNGVAYFGIPGADSKPGQIGNTPIAGHSSNDVLAPGGYKFIFAQLQKLEPGDTVYASYKGTRYTYVVTKTEEVLPTEIGKLIYQTDKPVLTLITCTPLGTALKRLLVTAEQVSPSPATAAAAPTKKPASQIDDTDKKMPGLTPTIFEALFNLFN